MRFLEVGIKVSIKRWIRPEKGRCYAKRENKKKKTGNNSRFEFISSFGKLVKFLRNGKVRSVPIYT